MGKESRKIRQVFSRIARTEVDKIRLAVIDNRPWYIPTFFWLKIVRVVLGDALKREN
jgi:hypothetical protein